MTDKETKYYEHVSGIINDLTNTVYNYEGSVVTIGELFGETFMGFCSTNPVKMMSAVTNCIVGNMHGKDKQKELQAMIILHGVAMAAAVDPAVNTCFKKALKECRESVKETIEERGKSAN